MIFNMKSWMMVAVVAAGLMTSCSSGSSNDPIPETPSTPETPTTPEEAQTPDHTDFTIMYYFADDFLKYYDAKVAYTDMDGTVRKLDVVADSCQKIQNDAKIPVRVFVKKITGEGLKKFPGEVKLNLELAMKDTTNVEFPKNGVNILFGYNIQVSTRDTKNVQIHGLMTAYPTPESLTTADLNFKNLADAVKIKYDDSVVSKDCGFTVDEKGTTITIKQKQ